jgi:hypothetical protein
MNTVTFTITNSNGLSGGLWNETYSSKEGAAEAIADCMAWDGFVLSESFSVVDGNGVERTAWCAYESQEDCDNDPEGAHAPRVVSG